MTRKKRENHLLSRIITKVAIYRVVEVLLLLVIEGTGEIMII